jgi:hypothetical protein
MHNINIEKYYVKWIRSHCEITTKYFRFKEILGIGNLSMKKRCKNAYNLPQEKKNNTHSKKKRIWFLVIFVYFK